MELLAYRYLLSTTLDERPLDEKYLHYGAEKTRAQNLASPAGLSRTVAASRPTLELLKVLQRWQLVREANRLYDV